MGLKKLEEGNNIVDSPAPLWEDSLSDSAPGATAAEPRGSRIFDRRLVRLSDIMRALKAGVLLDLMRGLDFPGAQHFFDASSDPQQVRKIAAKHLERRTTLREYYSVAREECHSLGLIASEATIGKLLKLDLNTATGEALRELLDEFYGRLLDELSSVQVMSLSLFESGLYTKPTDKWEAVIKRYPRTRRHVEEASRCLACSRGTAAVFHLMLVMEVGLAAAARVIDIPYAPSWEAYLRQMKRQLELAWDDKTPALRRNEEYIREAYGLLLAVKVAWRNPTMHVRREEPYTPEDAEAVYNAVRGFMRHLASKAVRKRV